MLLFLSGARSPHGEKGLQDRLHLLRLFLDLGHQASQQIYPDALVDVVVCNPPEKEAVAWGGRRAWQCIAGN